MSRLARVGFALLVCVTLGAFLVTQRLKQSPRIVRSLTITDAISPNGDERHPRASIRFILTRADNVTVSIINADDDVVRVLARDRRLAGKRPQQFFWFGNTSTGGLVPDGRYRIRVTLRHQGRSVILLHSILADTAGPHALVRITGLPVRAGGPVRFRVHGPVPLRARYSVYRTDSGSLSLVERFLGVAHSHVGTWDGLFRGRPAPPGTYVIVARLRDRVGNLGTSFPFTHPHRGDPPGGAGVTFRALAAQPPADPVPAGRRFTVFVDARGRPYTWRLDRLGSRARAVARGRATRPGLRLTAPEGTSAVYLLRIRAGTRVIVTPVAVQGPSRHRMLLVLPTISWQGRNPVDDDANGLPNVLGSGRTSLRLARPFAGNGLPRGFASNEARLLRFAAHRGLRYDITTDLALARAGRVAGAILRAHRGVVLAGNPEWIPLGLAQTLRGYVRGGGHVFSLGTRALRRSVRVGRDRLSGGSALEDRDAFGARIGPLVRRPVSVVSYEDARLALFAGTDGLFGGFDAYERTLSVGPGARVLAAAGPRAGQPVLLGYRLGRGLVIRTGLPQWSARLRNDPDVAATTVRAWTLSSR